jgi:photosystem II stability/assembly factor-like uncharacterized protein
MDRWPIRLFCCFCFLGEVRGHAADAFPESNSEILIEDASLHDVVFVDPEFGWAVGDRGALWHTADGGQNWRTQKSSTAVDLHGVWLADRNLGWAVGGRTFPYLWTSQATILRTTDGGATWQEQLALLPALERVKFFDAEHGVAWGRGSGGEPLGVFASDDSGRNWRPVAVGNQSTWWGGDFESQHTGIIVGAGQSARITNGDVSQLSLGEHDIRAVRFSDNGTAWAVGDAGSILRSADSGATWNAVNALPDDLPAVIAWHTIATHGQQMWIAGAPGTVVLHSPDGGETWQGHATGSNVSIRKLTFVDELHGWAVGDLGMIMHTADGGQTWQMQHRGGERAAVMMICTDENQLPLETLAKLSSDGYRTVVHLFSSKTNFANPSHRARLSEALSLVGCNAFASCRVDELLNEGAQTHLLEQMACQLRIWRPAVVVIQSGDGKQIAEIAELSVRHAADEQQLNYLSEQLALSPWQVSRVFAQLPAGGRGTHRVDSTGVAPFAGKTWGEMATAARSLLHHDFQAPPQTNEFLLKASYAGEPTAAMDDLAAGLSLVPGSDCRRPTPTTLPTFDPQLQRRLAEKRRNLANIFRFAEGNPALLAQVGQLMGDLAEHTAADLLFELAAQFEQAGQLRLAVDTRELLVRRCPNHPLAEQSLTWLVQFYASSETAHAYRQLVSDVLVSNPVGSQRDPGIVPATAIEEIQPDEAATIADFADQRYDRALQFAEHIAQTRPLLNAEPQLRVPAAIASRNRSRPEPQAPASGNAASAPTIPSPDASAFGSKDRAQRYLESLSLRYPGEAWQECGMVERWLAEPDKPLPRKLRVVCRFTKDKPMLDGKLDEAFWQQKATELKTGDTPSAIPNSKSEIVLAHDEEYLYLAVRCAKCSEILYSSEGGPRTYDADLSLQDRLRIFLDLDRDYTTYFVLTVDHRGWTNDACWRDQSWNPKWFVASGGDAEHWNVEAAIPRGELTSTPPKIGEAWTIACERIMPGLGTQVLSGSDVEEFGPQQFGVLVFK